MSSSGMGELQLIIICDIAFLCKGWFLLSYCPRNRVFERFPFSLESSLFELYVTWT
jgi:hypothetical protein